MGVLKLQVQWWILLTIFSVNFTTAVKQFAVLGYLPEW
jgi:hypothetical protein